MVPLTFSQAETTQGDLLAMLMYAIALIYAKSKSDTNLVCTIFADDAYATGSIKDLH